MCLLPETGRDGAAKVAERIRRRIAGTPLGTTQGAVPTSISVGIAVCPEHGTRLETLSRNADRALYASRALGRNRVTLFSSS